MTKTFGKKIKLIIIFIIISSIVIIYVLDKILLPTVIAVSEGEMKLKAMEVVKKCILGELDNKFKYNEVINVEKDMNGNIVMLRADTVKLNQLATNIALKSQGQLNEVGRVGINLTLGYITKNNLLSYLGPKITVKMEPLSNVQATYSSVFESVGVNQSIHRIYIKFKTDIRIIFPIKSFDVELNTEMPIAETVIMGKVPDTSIQMDLSDVGYKNSN